MGRLKIPFLFSTRYVQGGPVRDAPESVFCVKLAPEVNDARHDLLLPIRDYSIPEASDAEVRDVLYTVLARLANREPVYVGCLGGKGRTGLFLALLAKAVGINDPIGYVRREYNEHAVETTEQAQYVKDFPVWPLFPALFFLNFTAARADWQCN